MAELKKTELREKLRELSDKDLVAEIGVQRGLLFSLRQRNQMKQLNNTAAIRDARRTIARAQTILRERELGIRSEK
jgi:large subunit ribosomal protein L29